jgi:membrane-associated protease RseP (regulator of RpoE activity)
MTDTFNVQAQNLASNLTLRGGDPIANPNGDILNFDAQGNPVTAGPGTLSASGTSITFSQIENVNLTGAAATVIINGTALDDVLTVGHNGTLVTYQLTSNSVAHPVVTLPAGVSLVFNAGDGSDELIVDYDTMFFTTAIT